MKSKSTLFLTLILCLSILSVFQIEPIKAQTNYYTTTDNQSEYATGITYSEAQAKTNAEFLLNNSQYISVEQVSATSWNEVTRGFLYINTSSLPSYTVISSATLYIYVAQINYFGGQSFNPHVTPTVVIQNGQPTYPSTPLAKSDFSKTYYSGNGGSASISSTGWQAIPLSSDGLSWINKGNITKLCLRLADDINAVASNSSLLFYSAQSGYPAYLAINYNLESYTITPFADAHSSISPANAQTVTYGGSITFNYAALAGYTISNVRVDNSSVPITGSYTFSDVTASHTIEVFSTKDIYCSSSPSATGTLANSSVYFSSVWATDPSYTLSGYILATNNSGSWTNSTWTPFSGSSTANQSVTLTSNVGQTVGFRFYANDSSGKWGTSSLGTLTTSGYYIMATHDPYSTITPSGLVPVCYCGTQTFLFSADIGRNIQTVVINGVTLANTTSPYIFNNVISNGSIAVSTSNIIYYVNASSDDGSIIYPNGIIAVPYGTNLTLTASPKTGYQLSDLVINGSSAGINQLVNNQYIFMPTGNTTLYLVSQAVSTPVVGFGGGSTIIVNGNNTAPTATPTPVELNPMVDFGIFLIVAVLVLAVGFGYYQSRSKRGKSIETLFKEKR